MSDQPTPQQIEAMATPVSTDDSGSGLDPSDTAAYFGNPKILASKTAPKASADSNNQAAMLGPDLARGAVAGTVGIPGDLESLFKTLENHYHGTPDAPVTTTLPTTSGLNQSLPGKTEGGMGDLATGVGNLLGPSVAGDAAKGVGVVAKWVAPATGDLVDAAHTALGGKSFIFGDPGTGNPLSWPGLQRGTLLGREYKNFGAGIPLDRHLDDLGEGMGFLKPVITDMSNGTRADNAERGFELPMSHPPREGVEFNTGAPGAGTVNPLLLAGERPEYGESILNVHTHPANSLALPSYPGAAATGGSGDIGHWNWRTGVVAPNESMTGLVVNTRNPGMIDYTSRTIPGQSDLMDPRYLSPVIKNLEDAVQGGAFRDAIHQALDDTMTPSALVGGRTANMMKILNMAAGHLPHAYFDPAGFSNSAHNFSDPTVAAVLRTAWPTARDVVGNMKAMKDPGFASGGTIQGAAVGGPQTVGLAQFAQGNTGGQGATSGGSGGQSGDPTNYLSGMTPAAPATSQPTGQQYVFGDGSTSNTPLPTQQVAGAPVYSTAGFGGGLSGNSGAGPGALDPAAKATLTAGGQGFSQQGLEAFTGGLQDIYSGMAAGNGVNDNNGATRAQEYANAISFLNSVGDTQSASQIQADQDAGDANSQQNAANLLRSLANTTYKGYVNIGGLSQGWDGSNNPRSASNTIYMDNGQGQLIPVTNPSHYVAPTNKGYLKSEPGQDLIGALSVMAPAIGGVGGLASTAASGAGATAGEAAAASSAASAGLSGLTGGVTGLGSNLAGQLGGYLGGLTGVTGASTLGSKLGSYFASQALQKKT